MGPMPHMSMPPMPIPMNDMSVTPDLQTNIHMIQRTAMATYGLFQYHCVLATHYDSLLAQLNTLQTDWEKEYSLLVERQNQEDGISPKEKEPTNTSTNERNEKIVIQAKVYKKEKNEPKEENETKPASENGIKP